MGKAGKFNARGPAAYQRELKDLPLKEVPYRRLIVFSLRDFDGSQGQNFEEWEAEGLLAKAICRLQFICALTCEEAKKQSIIKPYNKVAFPPVSTFTHPRHIPPGVVWCSMHVQGKECVIGHFEEEVFYIVFLDKNHEFWQTEKKNT